MPASPPPKKSPRKHPGLAPRPVFLRRMATNGAVASAIIVASLAVGMIGYHGLAGLAWIDAFQNAAMIMSGMGPVDTLTTSGAKLFAGLYAIYSGIALIATAGFLFTPIAHRLLHRFHLEDAGDEG
jgi:hypothetical protein